MNDIATVCMLTVKPFYWTERNKN